MGVAVDIAVGSVVGVLVGIAVGVVVTVETGVGVGVGTTAAARTMTPSRLSRLERLLISGLFANQRDQVCVSLSREYAASIVPSVQ